MFVTTNQIFVFLACASFGGVIGCLFSVSIFIKEKIKIKWIKILLDVIAFMVSTILYVVYAYKMHFPNLRLYMILGVMVGIISYLKSFHIILAKLLKKAYNIIKSKKAKSRYDRSKDEKADSCNNGRRSITNNNTVLSHGVRNNKD
jgi:hypothetical protein